MSHMQEVLDAMHTCADSNKMILNSKKTKDMWIYLGNRIAEPSPFTTAGEMIERVSSFKLLGVWQQDNLKWTIHIEKVAKNSNKSLFCLKECRRINLPTEVGIMCYQLKMRSLLEYRAPIWAGIPQYLVNKVESIHTRSLRILGLPKD